MVSGDTDPGEGDSEDDMAYYENQCLFLRTMNATLPEEVWQQVALEEEEENKDEDAWKEAEGDVDPPYAYRSFGYRGNADRRGGISGQGRSNNRGGMQSESRDLSLVPSEIVDNAGSLSTTSVSRSDIALDASSMASDLPSRLTSLADHPSITINRFLLRNSSSQTTMAISVDQDWMSAIREDDVTLPSSEELLKRILESHRVCESEGVVFLEPKRTDETVVPPVVVEGETENSDFADNGQELEPTMAEVEDLEGSNRYPPDGFRRLVDSYQRLLPPYPAIDVHPLSFLPSYSPPEIELPEPNPDLDTLDFFRDLYPDPHIESLDFTDDFDYDSVDFTLFMDSDYDERDHIQSSGANIVSPIPKQGESAQAGDADIGKETADGLKDESAENDRVDRGRDYGLKLNGALFPRSPVRGSSAEAEAHRTATSDNKDKKRLAPERPAGSTMLDRVLARRAIRRASIDAYQNRDEISAAVSQKQPNKTWSSEETRMLVDGCNLHGIGNWEAMLQDPNLKFYDRSAVDLEDRFRTHFPDVYMKRYPNSRTQLSSNKRAAFEDPTALSEKRMQNKRRRPFTEVDRRAVEAAYEKSGTLRREITVTGVNDPIPQVPSNRVSRALLPPTTISRKVSPGNDLGNFAKSSFQSPLESGASGNSSSSLIGLDILLPSATFSFHSDFNDQSVFETYGIPWFMPDGNLSETRNRDSDA